MKLDLRKPPPSCTWAGRGVWLVVLVGACAAAGAGPKTVGESETDPGTSSGRVDPRGGGGVGREGGDGGGADAKVAGGPVSIGVEGAPVGIGVTSGAVVSMGTALQHLPLTVTVDGGRVVRRVNKRRFLGSNLALTDRAATYDRPETKDLLSAAGIGLLRLPGGLGGLAGERNFGESGLEQYFWNGKGVRDGKGLNRSKFRNGRWWIDYSGWVPGFYSVAGSSDIADSRPRAREADCNVKQQLDFVRSLGAEAMASVDADSGSARDAAEWVRWTNAKMGYGVKLWEVSGGKRPRGSAGTSPVDSHGTEASAYAEAYETFAREMKKADSTILVGAHGGIEAIKAALSRGGAPIDFVALRDFFTPHANTADAMFDTLEKIRQKASEIREILARLRPDSNILAGISEYNCKLYPDEQTADVNSGLWLMSAIGEMMYGGLDFAIQWNAFAQDREKGGGHGFLIEDGEVPKAEYWAFTMLNRYFGDTLLAVDRSNPYARVYASRDASGNVYVIVVNTSQYMTFDAQVDIKTPSLSPVADCARFSEREYAWDPGSFSPLWNGGPTEFRARAAPGARLTVPRASAVACRWKAEDAASRLLTLGPTRLALAPQGMTTVKVAAYDATGHPSSGTLVRAGVSGGFSATPDSARTGDDGTAVFAVHAPFETGEGRLVLHADGMPDAEQSLRVVSPSFVAAGPVRAQVGETAWFWAGMRYQDGSRYRFLEGPSVPGTVRIRDANREGPERQLAYDSAGLSSFSVRSTAVGTWKVEVEALGASTKQDITFFDRVPGDALAFTFGDAESLKHLRGNSALRINPDVRAGDGVLEVRLQGVKGWTQHLVDFEQLDAISSLDRDSIRAVYFDLMVDDKLDTRRRYAQFVVVLESDLNSWMPLEKIDLSRFPRGRWQRVLLPIGNPDWQKSMKALRRIVTVVNSGAELDGALYFDNVGFLLQRPR